MRKLSEKMYALLGESQPNTENLTEQYHDEERIEDELFMTASNEGRFYQKKDAKGAVEYAAKVMEKNYAADLRETLKAIKPKVIKELKKRWMSKNF
jgi:hypothetical protein